MASKVKLNSRGIETILKSSAVKSEVEGLAEKVADNVRGQNIDVVGIPGDIDLPVRVSVYETDRARASVMLAHPSGLAVQAKHGLLTRAAAAAGLEVKS